MDLAGYTNQAKLATHKLWYAIPFMIENKLWVGFFKHRLVLSVSLLAAVFIPWSIYEVIRSTPSLFDSSIESKHIAASFADNVTLDKIFTGSNQYLVMALIHMLNVYFSNKTIERLSGVSIDLSLKEMIASQIRNIKVIVRNWFVELLVGISLYIFIGLFGPDWLVDGMKFLVGSFFLGYIYIDNYNNAFGISIKNSFPIVVQHAGAALTFGIVTKILFLIPFVGVVFSSFICGVASTWYMHTSSDKHVGSEAYAN